MSKILSIRHAAVAGALLLAAGQGCGPVQLLPGNIYEGIEDIIEQSPVITTFDGEWLSTQYGYAVQIINREGFVTFSNSDFYGVGDTIIVLITVDGISFSGRHMFTDGVIHDIIGTLADSNTIQLVGGGYSWTLSRLNENRPPVATPLTVVTTYQTPAAITLAASDIDGGPQPLTFSLQSFPVNGRLTGTPPQLTYTPNAGFRGNDSFVFVASDGAAQGTATVSISVAPPANETPLVDAGTNQTVALASGVANLDGTVADDGQPNATLTVTWSVVSGPAAVQFLDAHAVDTQASFTVKGVYTLKLEASDGALTGSDTMTVFVN